MGKIVTVKAHMVKAHTRTLKDTGKSYNPKQKSISDPLKAPAATKAQIDARKMNLKKLSKGGVASATALLKSIKK